MMKCILELIHPYSYKKISLMNIMNITKIVKKEHYQY
jgi:hypothetical protein